MKNTASAASEAVYLAAEQEHHGHASLNFLMGPCQCASPLTYNYVV